MSHDSPDRPALTDVVLGAAREDRERVSLNVQNDFFDGIRDRAERTYNWRRRERPSIVEAYEKGDIELCVETPIAGDDCDYQLVVSRVPFEDRESSPSGNDERFIERPAFDLCGNSTNDAMFSPSCLVHVANDVARSVIPSWVRLEPFKRRVQFWREVLFDPTLQVRRICCDRKVETIRSVPLGDGLESLTRGLIEGEPHVHNAVEGNFPQPVGKWLTKAELMSLLPSLWVCLDHASARMGFKECVADTSEFGHVIPCLSDQKLGAIKQVHG